MLLRHALHIELLRTFRCTTKGRGKCSPLQERQQSSMEAEGTGQVIWVPHPVGVVYCALPTTTTALGTPLSRSGNGGDTEKQHWPKGLWGGAAMGQQQALWVSDTGSPRPSLPHPPTLSNKSVLLLPVHHIDSSLSHTHTGRERGTQWNYHWIVPILTTSRSPLPFYPKHLWNFYWGYFFNPFVIFFSPNGIVFKCKENIRLGEKINQKSEEIERGGVSSPNTIGRSKSLMQ